MRVAFVACVSLLCLICMVSSSSLFNYGELENGGRCRDGSFFFNGSCYFVSNRKQPPASRFWPSALKLARDRKEKSQSPNSIDSKELLRTQFVAASIPRKDNWEAARIHCSKLNNDSSIIVIESDSEFESLIDLLFQLNSASFASTNPEAIYFIGLRYQNSTWRWTNENLLNKSSLVQLQIDSNLNDYNGARTCAALNLNANGQVTVELLNCQIMPAPFICKYTVDRCYNNGQCSRNGDCINSPQTKSFECRCRAFYTGSRCEKWSNQGIQMLISISLVIVALCAAVIYKFISYLGSRKKRRIEAENVLRPSMVLIYGAELLFDCWKMIRHVMIKKKKLIILIVSSLILSILIILFVSYARYKMIELRIEIYKNKMSPFLNPNLAEEAYNRTDRLQANKKQATEQFQRLASTFTRFFSIDFCATAKQRFMEDYMFCVVSLPLTAFIYLRSTFRCRSAHSCARNAKNPTKAGSGNSMLHNLVLSISRPLSRLRKLRIWCSCGAEFPVPMNPFSKRNRFMTAIVYAAYTYDILKIFEYLLVGEQQIGAAIDGAKDLYHNLAADRMLLLDVKGARDYIQQGILLDLVKQAVNVFIVGLKYYPVLLCFELRRKSKICFVLCAFYVWMIFGHYLLTNSFCLLSASNPSTMSDADSRLKYIEPTTNHSALVNESQALQNTRSLRSIRKAQTNYTASYLFSMEEMSKFKESFFVNNIMYEKFLFYAVLCLITMNTTIECVFLLANHIAFKLKGRRRLKRKTLIIAPRDLTNVHEFNKSEYLVDNLKVIKTKHVTSSNDELNGGDTSDLDDDYDEDGRQVNHEINYTRALYNANRSSYRKPISFARYLVEKYIYRSRKDFRFSKQYISTQIIALILLYYITSIVIRKSNLISDLASNLLTLLVNFVFKAASASSRIQTSIVVKALFARVSFDIILSCVIASSIYALQILLGIRNYHKHILDAYKGIYVDIPPPERFSNSKLTSSSLHFSGYSIGYMLWGYLVLFEVTAFIVIVIRFLFGFYLIAECMAKIVLPVLAIFLCKKLLIWHLSQQFMAEYTARGIKNRKLYCILNHFNFFFDCFLGSFVCFLRLLKACIAALLFMPRLDYSIFGRALERTDAGFVSYAAFIHMEVNQTHPVKIAFCKLLADSLKTPKSDSNQFDSDGDDADESSLVNKNRSRTMKNKWQVAYTLLKHPRLRKERKKHLSFKRFIPEVESFERFLERKGILSSIAKKRSQSTPSLNSFESDHNSELNSNFKKNLVIAENAGNAKNNFSLSTHKRDFTDESVYISNELSPHSHHILRAN